MDIEMIKQRIAEDKKKSNSSYRRYPVRFLFMEMNNDTQDEIEELVKSADAELLELSDYIIKKDDGWMTKFRFTDIIKNHTSRIKDTYVLGFSELIRFFTKKDIESTVLSLFDIENSNIMDDKCAHRRIYFICFSMMDNIYKVLQNSFARKPLINPFINADFELSGEYRKVCFVSNDYVDKIEKNKITTSVEWIGLWRHSRLIDFSSPIWCCSESLYKCYEKASPDNAFQIDVVHNTKDYLQKAFELSIAFPYSSDDMHYWEQLSAEYYKCGGGKNLQDFADIMLGIDVKSTSTLAGILLTTDSAFDKWFVRCYVSAYMPNTFLGRVLKMLKTNSRKELLSNIWKQGYWINDATLLEERVKIIYELNKYADFYAPEKEIQNAICEGVAEELCIEMTGINCPTEIRLLKLCEQTGREFSDMKKRLGAYYAKIFKPAFTGLSNTEKEFVINLYSNGVLDKYETKEVYPPLYMYLFGQAENRIEGKEDLKKYLEAYRESKVAGVDNSYLEHYYLDGCANSTNFYSMYYALQHQEKAVSPYLEGADVYIMDGVGAEYLPFMVEMIKRNGYDIEFCDYATCHLPSITDVNRDYLSSLPYKEWFYDFDREVIHGDCYRTSVNLRKAFDILEIKLKEIIQDSTGKRIAITADHGATARARWTDTKKKYDFSLADHEGRCCKITSKTDYEDTVDYIVYEDEEKSNISYIVSLNDTSLYNRPKYEDHGGATIEEVLVPVIVAIPHDVTRKISYKVLGADLEVSGLDKGVSFIIIPDPDEEVYVVETDMTRHVLKKAEGVYSATLLSGKEQDIMVVIAEKEYKFHTMNVSKKNMEGDDGFDD